MSENKDLEMELEDVIVLEDEDGNEIEFELGDKLVYEGKEYVVLVSSQNGTPIGLFQGNDCYTEIPADLPKTTLINIDGKMVYVHRANVDIIPAELFGE